MVGAVLSAVVKWPGSEADSSPPSNAEVKNTWSYTSTPIYYYSMAWSRTKYQGQLFVLLFALCYINLYCDFVADSAFVIYSNANPDGGYVKNDTRTDGQKSTRCRSFHALRGKTQYKHIRCDVWCCNSLQMVGSAHSPSSSAEVGAIPPVT
jgi:hypothetical protein